MAAARTAAGGVSVSKHSEPTTSKALEELRYALANGKAVPKVLPERLDPYKIRLNPAVFQHRYCQAKDSEAHIRAMAASLNAGISVELEPVTVWWDGNGWCCIDGHHRLAAYGKSIAVRPDVPVWVFTGTLDEAIAQAAQGNTSVKLNMSVFERRHAAWRLVCTTALPKSIIVAVSKVSDRTVGNMRSVKGKLVKLGHGDGACDLAWLAAMAKARGLTEPQRDDWDDEAQEVMAQEWGFAMRKCLPPNFADKVSIFARAVEILSSQLPDRLVAEWRGNDE